MADIRINDFSYLNSKADVTMFLETRMENDANGNPIYIGYAKKDNAPTNEAVWYIVKITYDVNESPTYQQLPNQGTAFKYVWDSRSTYF